jgi:hypothetical protein
VNCRTVTAPPIGRRQQGGYTVITIQVLHRDRAASKIPGVLELEVYVPGVRDLNKIVEWDHEVEPCLIAL